MRINPIASVTVKDMTEREGRAARPDDRDESGVSPPAELAEDLEVNTCSLPTSS